MLKISVFYVFILCVFCYGSTKRKDNVYLNESLSTFDIHIRTECAFYLRSFANATQQFNRCLVKHAKPLRICEKCTAQYSAVRDGNPVEFNNSHCVNDLVKSERFQVVMKVYDFQTGLWESAHCNKCYKSPWNLTDDTAKFFHRLKKVTHCFENYIAVHKNDNSSANVSLCSACGGHYLGLRRIYDSLLQKTKDKMEDELCVDIMSLMNDTRKDWTRYNCNEAKDKNYTVLSLSGVFGFLTFIFYAGVRKHEKYKSKIQTRFRKPKQVVNYDSE